MPGYVGMRKRYPELGEKYGAMIRRNIIVPEGLWNRAVELVREQNAVRPANEKISLSHFLTLALEGYVEIAERGQGVNDAETIEAVDAREAKRNPARKSAANRGRKKPAY